MTTSLLCLLLILLCCQLSSSYFKSTTSFIKPYACVNRDLQIVSGHRSVSLQAKPSTEVDVEVDVNSAPSKSLIPPWFPSFSTACLGGLLFGMDIGSSSSVLRVLGEGHTVLGNLDSFQLGQIAGASLFGAIISSAFIALTGDKAIGRKFELKVAAALFLLGSIVQSTSDTFSLELVGRAIYGLGIGTAMHVAPLYIAETSPNALRGKLVSFKEAAIVGGIVAGYGAGALLGGSNNWQGIFLSAIPFEILMGIGAFIVPESPRWLALRGKVEESKQALIQVQGLTNDAADTVVEEMITMSKQSQPTSGTGSAADPEADSAISKLSEIFSSKYNKRALTIGLGLVLFQQLSGQPSVLYFANRIFEQAGLGFEAAVAVGLFKLVMTSISAYLVENPSFGRRSLLLYGNIGITISLLLLSYLYGHPVDPASLESGNALQSQLGIIVSMFLFVGSYQIGFGPITWLVLSEIFPLRVRSAAVSLGTLTNFASNLLVTLLFEAERKQFGESALFLQFAGIALLSVFFTFKYVFETRGLSLEEIEMKLQKEVDGN